MSCGVVCACVSWSTGGFRSRTGAVAIVGPSPGWEGGDGSASSKVAASRSEATVCSAVGCSARWSSGSSEPDREGEEGLAASAEAVPGSYLTPSGGTRDGLGGRRTVPTASGARRASSRCGKGRVNTRAALAPGTGVPCDLTCWAESAHADAGCSHLLRSLIQRTAD